MSRVTRGVEIEGASIVLVGDFTPGRFSPSWLVRHGLVGDLELDRSDVQVVSQEFTSFQAGWLGLSIQRERLQLTTDRVDELERLRDAAVELLRVLDDAPVTAVGVNRDYHIAMASRFNYDAVGHYFAPKDLWLRFMDAPGLRNLVIEGERNGQRVQARIEPSVRISNGVYVGLNTHLQAVPVPSPETSNSLAEVEPQDWAAATAEIQDFLVNDWQDIMTWSEDVWQAVNSIPDARQR